MNEYQTQLSKSVQINLNSIKSRLYEIAFISTPREMSYMIDN